MKRKLLILSILTMCVAILASGTLAFQTASGRAHNVITSGNVKIEIQEWADTEKKTPFENLDGLYPGFTATKIVEVVNTGSADAWVRVKIEKNITPASEQTEVDPDLVVLDLNTTDWTYREDGYYYYNSPLEPGEVTAPVLNGVTLSGNMGSEYQEATVEVKVSAEAVQSQNNDTATGWPE